jgi:hypothetical protein
VSDAQLIPQRSFYTAGFAVYITLGVMKTILLTLIAISATASAQVPILGALEESELDMGCGCSFHVPAVAKYQGKRILYWQDPDPARIRLDGQLLKLTVGEPRSSTPSSRAPRIGDRVNYSLTADGVKVAALCKATRVCSSEDESCESTEYSATISVATAKGKVKVQAWAVCGC